MSDGTSHDFNTELDGGQSFDSLLGIQKDWDLNAQESFGGKPNAAEELLVAFSMPWCHGVSKDQDQYVTPVYLPPRFKVTDPLKMHKRETITLLDFWRAHQDKDKQSVFAFSWWRGSDGMLQEPVDIDSTDNVQQVPMKKLKSGQRAVVVEKDRTPMTQGTANDYEGSDRLIEWPELDVPKVDRGHSEQRNKGKAKRVRRIVNSSEDELPGNQESPERLADGQAGRKDRVVAGHVESLKARMHPKPTLKGKAVKPMDAKGSSSSKRARAPGGELEEVAEVDALWPAKKAQKDFSERCRDAATPFPDANDVPSSEETRRLTCKRKAPLPTDFGVSPKTNGGASRKCK
ncbi:hypothetical protein PAXRUDRAFT_14244 [Paxillus rubicundulus Ve08.2h10]|uniref:Uncharacterized protein n=1 Tax=Paxillus rubicundulus Ve08.2h10 TaxID=930991 RepID=A0A0D0DWS5_9AGAM|nr:hypothetical protein PAXRUDRAFT_14244 [Paxillus rubicundulus Ve08.2h10]